MKKGLKKLLKRMIPLGNEAHKLLPVVSKGTQPMSQKHIDALRKKGIKVY